MKASHLKSKRVPFCLTLLAVGVLAGCGSEEKAPAAERSAESSPAAAATGSHAGHSAGAGAAVEMRLIQFRPKQLDVTAGEEVTWTQKDAGFHTVTSGSVEQSGGTATRKADGKFSSERLATDQIFKFTFSEPGTYPYFCEIHPATMTGEVRVGA